MTTVFISVNYAHRVYKAFRALMILANAAQGEW